MKKLTATLRLPALPALAALPALPALLVLLAPLALAPACRPAGGADPPAQQSAGQVILPAAKARAAGIAVAAVGYQELDRELAAAGRVAFDDQRVAHVFSPVSGRVVELIAPPGARVRKGDALARIDSPDLGSADSDLAKARAAYEAANREHQRQRELFAAHAAAQRDLEAAESNARQARAEMERAQGRVRLLGAGTRGRVSQEYLLRAPISGEVIARAVNPGAEVQGQYSGGTGAELYTIGELDRVWVMADVFEMDLARVKAGAPVEVQVVSFPGRRLAGRVEWISGTVDPATRTAKVRCALDNPERLLKPEMYATVSIAVPGRQALAVPRSAVLRQGEQTVVFRALGTTAKGELKFQRWPVKVDEEGNDGAAVPVVAGLRPGDRIVTSGGILLLGML